MSVWKIFYLSQIAISADDGTFDATQTDTFASFFSRLFKADFMPHGHCFFWRADVVWLHVISDLLIVLAYYSIPIMLLFFRKKRRDLPYPWMFALFAGFIFWCGTTHLMSVVTLWIPVYRAEGLVKLFTASISVLTAFLLFPLIPQALSLRSAKELEEKNKELKEAYDSVIKQREKTQEERAKREELEKFAYIASHDLREPLRTISLFADLLKKEGVDKLTPQSEEYFGYITGASSRMRRVIEDLVFYSLIDASQSKTDRVLVVTCLQSALENLSVATAESGAVISSELSEDIHTTANQIQLTQVFQNLIGNAIKFRKKEHAPQIQIQAREENDMWVISVADNGIGIEEEYFDRVFLLFKRLHSSEDQYPGTGMGLAICKKIVEQLGGKIWITSEPNQGSTFSFSIPKA